MTLQGVIVGLPQWYLQTASVLVAPGRFFFIIFPRQIIRQRLGKHEIPTFSQKGHKVIGISAIRRVGNEIRRQLMNRNFEEVYPVNKPFQVFPEVSACCSTGPLFTFYCAVAKSDNQLNQR